MRTIHRLDLERLIKTQKINFIAFVQTPWHALGVDAFIKYKEEKGSHLVGTVCVMSHAQAGMILDEKSFSYENCDIEVVYYTDGVRTSVIKKIKNAVCNSQSLIQKNIANKEFYILATVHPKYQWHSYIAQNCDKKAVSVLIDEGLGMYMRNTQDWLMETWSGKSRVLKKIKYTYEFCIGNPSKEKILEANNSLMYFCLFIPDNMRVNYECVAYYKKVLKLNESRNYSEAKGLSFYENAVVINTQPYFDEGQIIGDSDINLIEQICTLCGNRGIKVVLKPHPREKSIDRYTAIKNCIVDTNFAVSQESIISCLDSKPRLLVGLCSTTLISMDLFYGVKTVSLIHCISYDGVKKKMRTDLQKFEKVFGNTVCCPNNIPELEMILDKI